MTNPIPAPLAIDLSTIANGLTEDATPVASSLAALEAAINSVLAALSGGAAGQFLEAIDGSDVAWGNAASSFTTGAVANSFASLGAIVFSSLLQIISSAAGNNAFVAAVQGDTQWRVQIHADGTILIGPGNAAADTSVARTAPGQLTIGGTAGKGNIVGGAVSTSKGGGSWAPDAATLFNRMSGTAVGSYTIAAPTNPPGANQSAIMVICIHNASGGAMTLSWDAAFNTVPAATVGAGSALTSMWAWNPSTSKWDLTGAQVAAD